MHLNKYTLVERFQWFHFHNHEMDLLVQGGRKGIRNKPINQVRGWNVSLTDLCYIIESVYVLIQMHK